MFKDRAIETIQAGFTGTGTYNLGGSASNSQALDAAFGSGATLFYVVRTTTWSKVEIGFGVVTSGSPDTLTRNVKRSYNGSTWGTSEVSWVSGDHPLYVYSAPVGEALAETRRTHRGTTAPTPAEPGMLWEDTSGGVTATLLKIRDSADWITIGTINETANTFTAAGQPTFASSGEVATGTEAAKIVAPDTLAANYHAQGRQTIWIPAGAMIARSTNGAASLIVEQPTNKTMLRLFSFNQTTQQYVQFAIAMPKEWDEGTVTFVPYWYPGVGSGGVVWDMAGVAVSNDDVVDAAFGTAQKSTDTVLALGDLHVGPESSAITIAGSPAVGDIVLFQISRVVADAGDTSAADAHIHGVQLFFTTNARNSA